MVDRLRRFLQAGPGLSIATRRPEARIGAELKAAQARGEVATQDRHGRSRNSVRSSDTVLPATLSDLNIPRQRASEMKKLAELGEEVTGTPEILAASDIFRPRPAALAWPITPTPALGFDPGQRVWPKPGRLVAAFASTGQSRAGVT